MITTKEGLKEISRRLRNYRVEYPLTQKQLADISGVSLRSIQRFEKGEDIQFSNLIKLLNAMQLEGNLYALIPDVTKRPSAFVENRHTRQRARISKSGKVSENAFRWGDEQ